MASTAAALTALIYHKLEIEQTRATDAAITNPRIILLGAAREAIFKARANNP